MSDIIWNYLVFHEELNWNRGFLGHKFSLEYAPAALLDADFGPGFKIQINLAKGGRGQ